MPWVYVLRCADDSFYVGSTIDLSRRLEQHQRGEGAIYTRISRRRPLTLAWASELDTIEAAFRLEKQIQGWSRAKRLALIDGRLEDLPGLSRSRSGPAPD